MKFVRAFAATLLTASLAGLGLIPATAAAAWPEKPVRVVIPYPPGGNVDSAARIVSERLAAIFKQPFIVDNKPGAGGMIAGEAAAQAAPDGYTLFIGANGPILFSPLIFKRNSYNWKTSFVPISSVSFTPLVLQVNPQTPYKTFGELIDAAKKKPDQISMASPGAGTQNHLVSEMLQTLTGAHWLTVHYKGNAPATTDLLGGQVQFNFDQLSVCLPYIRDGRTRALGVTSAQRLPELPDVPTLIELGFKGFTTETFTGMLAPTGTPQAIVDQLSKATQEILREPAVRERFKVLGAEARGSSPQAFGQYLQSEDDRWSKVIKAANITAE